MNRVPIPSLGRIVLFALHSSAVVPAVIVAVHGEFDRADPRSYRSRRGPLPASYYKVDVVALMPIVLYQKVSYGENKPGCWWWPPKTTDEMEVD